VVLRPDTELGCVDLRRSEGWFGRRGPILCMYCVCCVRVRERERMSVVLLKQAFLGVGCYIVCCVLLLSKLKVKLCHALHPLRLGLNSMLRK
jgi:hypothetical protein